METHQKYKIHTALGLSMRQRWIYVTEINTHLLFHYFPICTSVRPFLRTAFCLPKLPCFHQ